MPGFPAAPPVGTFLDAYRIAGFQKDLLGTKKPECDLLAPR